MKHQNAKTTFQLLAIVLTVALMLSSCSFLSQNKEAICDTQETLCGAATNLWITFGDTTQSGFKVLTDICSAARLVCTIIPEGTPQQVEFAKMQYTTALQKFEARTINRPYASITNMIGAEKVEAWKAAKTKFEAALK